jgi:hypothetical protein
MTRLAAELELVLSGMTLSSRPGHRVIFGCSRAISHIIGPDHSTITFSSKADLVLRWLSVISVKIKRDWTWNGAENPAIVIRRVIKDKYDDTVIEPDSEVGSIQLPMIVNPTVFSASINSSEIDGTIDEESDDGIDRRFSEIIFFDAVDPHPRPGEYPEEKTLYYELIPRFRNFNLSPEIIPLLEEQRIILKTKLKLPITVPPSQTPRLVSAGIALSPYQKSDDYSSTEVQKRMLWLEFAEQPDNPDDTYFARVLFNSPDPMLTGLKQISEQPDAPPLPIDPEHMKVIFTVSSDDRAGLGAMQPLIPASCEDPRYTGKYFLLPLPPGLNERSRELFGFFDYELRVGHINGWSTARARFGPELIVSGIQHPAPPLNCSVSRTADSLRASATFAMPVYNGQSVAPIRPQTQLWMLLYAQVSQADGNEFRNLLIGRRAARLDESVLKEKELFVGICNWTKNELEYILNARNLPKSNPLSVMAVELLPELDPPKDPLGADLGKVRILRTSNLVKAGRICLDKTTGRS